MHLSGVTLTAGTLLLAGCATTGNSSDRVAMVDATIPQQWEHVQAAVPTGNPTPELTQWWKQFKDPVLDQLIERALTRNSDLRSAILRVEQVRLQKDLANIQRLPSASIGVSEAGSRVDSFETDAHSNSDSASASLSSSWEVDLFGKQKAAIQSAQAAFEATREDFYGVQVSLAAEVASTYLSLRSLQSEYGIVKQTLEMRSETLQITRWQEEAGEVNALQVQQAIVSLEQAKTSIPSLEQSMEETINALALLCSEQPAAIRPLLQTQHPIPQLQADIAVNIPAETLAQRPDIRAQRYRIEASFADLSAAAKERFPSLSISGSIGLNEGRFGDLFHPTQILLNLSGRLSQVFWDGGRIQNSIDLRNVALEQDCLNYENLVRTALVEVENALNAIQKAGQQLQLVATATEAARVSTDIAELQYEAGEVDLLSVLDSQRSLLSLEQSLINSQVKQLNAHIQLYKALGGGWTVSETI